MTVAREAIQAFYRQENLPAHGNVNVWVDWVTAFGIKFPFPNILGRNKVLPYHDLHHIVTGYRTDEAGEFEVGAWCLATGKNPLLAYLYDVPAALLGLIRFRKRTIAAWKRGRNCETLYQYPLEELLEMEVDALKELTRIDA